MPKDPTRNQQNYNIDGSHLNEYDFEKNKGQITEQEKMPERNAGQENAQQGSAGSAENTSASGTSAQ